MKYKWFYLVVLIVGTLSLVVVSCGEQPAPTSPSPKPAPAQAKYEWRLQSVYTPGSAYDVCSVELADLIGKMSDGRIKITVFPAGAIAPAAEMHTGVAKGQFEMASGAGAFMAGVLPEALIEFGSAGSPLRNWEEYNLFLYDYGFISLLEEAYNEVGLHYLAPVPWGWRNIISKKPIRSLADIKGMKVRATGLDAKWIEKLGAAPTFLQVPEIYTGMALGTVDAQIYGGPNTHWDLKLMEVAKYEILPAGGMTAANQFINLKLWNSLPDDLKNIITTAARIQGEKSYRVEEILTRKRIDAMRKDYGVQFITLPPADVSKMRAAGVEVMAEAGKANARTAKAIQILNDVVEYFKWRYDPSYTAQ